MEQHLLINYGTTPITHMHTQHAGIVIWAILINKNMAMFPHRTALLSDSNDCKEHNTTPSKSINKNIQYKSSVTK